MLHCCALRSAGIYGEGEERHFPRILRYIEQGLFAFTIGSPANLCDWVYVDNLVYAHVLAAKALLEPSVVLQQQQRPAITTSSTNGHSGSNKSRDAVVKASGEPDAARPPAAGRAYFINDDHPINNFEFFRPLVTGLDYPYPKIRVPYLLMFYIAWLMELLHWYVTSSIHCAGVYPRRNSGGSLLNMIIPSVCVSAESVRFALSHTLCVLIYRLCLHCRVLKPVYLFTPMLSRAEVNKTGVTHYFRYCIAG